MKPWKHCLAAILLALVTLPASAQGILIVGDSISAAFGLELERGWVSLLETRLREQSVDMPVVNASVSGDTTAGGLARLPQLLQQHTPELVIIELGGNDGLRGLAPDKMQQNLSAMIAASQQAGADVILLGMRIPPNYGVRYVQAFEEVYRTLGSDPRVALVPFVLEGVAGDSELMQADGIHPNAQGQPGILENAWPPISDWLVKQP